MELSQLYLVAAIIVAVLIVYLQRTQPQVRDDDGEASDDEAEVVGQAGRARGARARMRAGAAGAEDEGEEGGTRSLGKKKMASMQRKEMKKRALEHEVQMQEERRKREELLAQDRAKEEAEDRKRQQLEAEALRKARAAQEAEEQAAYEAVKGLITVEESGAHAHDQGVLLADFVHYVNSMKIVTIDSLAAKLRMKPQDVVDRIRTLEADGRLLGVLDDRGKFISLTMDELQQVAAFLERRGRVSVSELTQAVNTMVKVGSESGQGGA